MNDTNFRGTIETGDHLVLLYTDESKITESIVLYIQKCISTNQKVIYITGDSDINLIIKELKNLGIYESIVESGQLIFLDSTDAYSKDGSFSPDNMIELLKSEVDKAISEGFSGLGVSGEISWVLDYDDGIDLIFEYEWKLNDVIFNNYDMSALCRYNMDRFTTEMIINVIQLHPFVMLDGNVYENPYYVPAVGYKENNIPKYQLEEWLINITKFTNLKSDFNNRILEVEVGFSQSIQHEKLITQSYLDIMVNLLVVLDKTGKITLINKFGADVFGLSVKDMIGMDWFDNFIPKEYAGEVKSIFTKSFVSPDVFIGEYENEILIKNNVKRLFKWYNAEVKDINGNKIGVVASGIDITESKKYEKMLLEVSNTDSLTKLHNRRYYENHLQELDVDGNYPLSIVMGDINGLKLINDAFGHEKGDLLLCEASKLLKHSIPTGSLLARIGGDEFVFVLPKSSYQDAEKIVREIQLKSNDIEIESIKLSISFGVATKENRTQKIENVYRSAEDSMYRSKLLEIHSMRNSAIETIISTLNEKDVNSKIHSSAVSRLAENFAKVLDLSDDEISKAKTAGLLHDIGKIIIPSEILNKKDVLLFDEYEVIKSHSEIGFRILNSTTNLRDVSNIILCHHEKWDGSGYPRGIKGKSIPLLSRIITIVDSFDAMTSERFYRKTKSIEQAKIELLACSGSQFDAELVDVFTKNIEFITK